MSAPDDLPTVTIDHTLFGRALTNIIENALYAMPGGGRLTITVRLEPGATTAAPTVMAGETPSGAAPVLSRGINIAIADTGGGVDDEALAKMFQPYFSTKATGTGLGLTIAKRNIELIGGTIDVRSQRGTGTTVTIRLPVMD